MPNPLHRLGIAAALAAATRAPARAAHAAALPDGVGIRLLDAPVARANDPRAQAYVVDHLSPGATITRRVEISNGTALATKVKLYAAGAAVEGQTFRFLEGTTRNELSSWTHVTPQEVELASGAVAEATVTIGVPGSASEGERYAVVWAELPPTKAPDGGLSVVNRVGVRIYLSVGPGGEPASDFAVESLAAARGSDGLPVVDVGVRNIGGRALDLNGELTLSDGPGKLSAGPFQAPGTTLAIGGLATLAVPLDKDLPAGPWHARIVLRSGSLERAAEATLTFPSAVGNAAAPVAARPVGNDARSLELDLPPWAIAAGAAGTLGLALFFLLLIVRRRRERRRRQAATRLRSRRRVVYYPN